MKVVTLNEIKRFDLADGIRAHVVNTDSMSISHVELDKDAAVPEHNHPHEQVVNVIRGQLELTVAGKTHLLSAGMAFVLAADVPHSARAVTDCYVIDVFHPVREDFR